MIPTTFHLEGNLGLKAKGEAQELLHFALLSGQDFSRPELLELTGSHKGTKADLLELLLTKELSGDNLANARLAYTTEKQDTSTGKDLPFMAAVIEELIFDTENADEAKKHKEGMNKKAQKAKELAMLLKKQAIAERAIKTKEAKAQKQLHKKPPARHKSFLQRHMLLLKRPKANVVGEPAAGDPVVSGDASVPKRRRLVRKTSDTGDAPAPSLSAVDETGDVLGGLDHAGCKICWFQCW